MARTVAAESLGYVALGRSPEPPRDLRIRYTSNRPAVVSTGTGQEGLTAQAAGVATVTAQVTYHGATTSTSFVVLVR
jgi:beta-glucosidase